MTMGTKWTVKFETTEGIGSEFIEGVIEDAIGCDDNDKPLIKSIKVMCNKEFTDEEYIESEREIQEMHDEHQAGFEEMMASNIKSE